MKAQRDVFIQALYEKALVDKDIVFISADMGAPTLDQWAENLGDQFIAAGISEQNAINVAAGMAKEGKKVFVYMMASWFARCYEQIRYSCAMANNAITILGNGVALGYAPSGPAHEPNEDMALARTLLGIEVYSPSNENSTFQLVNLCLEKPQLRYIRLERSFDKEIKDFTYTVENSSKVLLRSSCYSQEKIAIISSGYLLGRAKKVFDSLKDSYDIKLIDLWRIKPLDSKHLSEILSDRTHIVTLEEQTLDAGFGSAICEFLFDNKLNPSVKRIGLPEYYIFENGTRDHLLDTNGLSFENIKDEVLRFINNG
jgi:transketolase